MSVRRVFTVIACVFAVAPGIVGGAEQASLKNLVPRLTTYVSNYGDRASVIVATEHYTQLAETNIGDDSTTRVVAPSRQTRTLVSDFALVKTSIGWVGFRDVLSVDGKDVRDHNDRLARLLTAGPGGIEDARRVSEESARYNIGLVRRNFNVPTTALFFFMPNAASRFQFSMKADSAGNAHLLFREIDRAGLIHRPGGGLVPVDGELWLHSDDGTVVRTILRVHNFDSATTQGASTADIDVTYRRAPELHMWVPDIMSERYESRLGTGWNRVTGRAEYSDYRQFQTSVRIK